MWKVVDITGHVYGQLTVLTRAENNSANKAMWVCSCTCGSKKIVRASSLRCGGTQSCGCLKVRVRSTQGGGSDTKEYVSWKSMVGRCRNPKHDNYARYGAAGVSVCAEWLSDFQAFLSYIGPKPTAKHTLDRIDNTKGYEPGNVRWATPVEQNANRKNTTLVLHQGRIQPLALLARARGLQPMLVHNRVIRYGWSVERALNTPVAQRIPVSAPLGLSTAP
jgi:hypothetical protein